MAKIFVSYTSQDLAWQRWVSARLHAMGHEPLVHEDTPGGVHILRWMNANLPHADRFLGICSPAYFSGHAGYSNMERIEAVRLVAERRRDEHAFILFVHVECCSPDEVDPLILHYRFEQLHNRSVKDARITLERYVGANTPVGSAPCADEPPFPGWLPAVENLPQIAPFDLFNAEGVLGWISNAFTELKGRIAAIALTGMNGVGKSTVATAYAEKNRDAYRVRWWIRADNPRRAAIDLAALGVRLGWTAPNEDQKEDVDVDKVLRRLEDDGERILLIYDNAMDEESLLSLMPRRGDAHILITTNHSYLVRDLGPRAQHQLLFWPKELGADYLLKHVIKPSDRADAVALSDQFEGLPMAMKMAVSHCNEQDISLAAFRRRLARPGANPLESVMSAINASIDAAAKRHLGAEILIKHAALLPLEPIPRFLFEEADCFGETLKGSDGVDAAVKVLNSFTLISSREIEDERDPRHVTDTIKLHSLVRDAAAARWVPEEMSAARGTLISALDQVFPEDDYRVLTNWPRARRLEAPAFHLIGGDAPVPEGFETAAATLMVKLASFQSASTEAHSESRPLLECALKISEAKHGPDHPSVATILNYLALRNWGEGNMAEAVSLSGRALGIRERHAAADRENLALALLNLSRILRDAETKDHLDKANEYCDRAQSLYENASGPDSADFATCLSVKARIFLAKGRIDESRPLTQRALEIYKRKLGEKHPAVAAELINVASVLEAQNKFDEAIAARKEAIDIRERLWGIDREAPELVMLGDVCKRARRDDEARIHWERALLIYERMLEPDDPRLCGLLVRLDRKKTPARGLREHQGICTMSRA